jgi:anti-sigma B factor antagonist
MGGNVEINERKINNVTVIDLKMQNNVRGQYNDFQQLIRKRIAAGRLYFVLNLAECDWIDSAGLGELIKSLVHVMCQGGNLKLAAVPRKIKGILAITNLSSVFEIYDDEQAALASYAR